MFTGKWAYNWGAYKLGGGLKAVVYGSLCQTCRYCAKRTKEQNRKKNLFFLMLYFSLSECLERVIISYIAVLSYLEQ